MSGLSSSVATKVQLSLSEKIAGVNKAINLMGARGNNVRFDNYKPTQLIEVQQSFPNTEIKVRTLGNKYFMMLEVEHVTIFSKTLTDEE